MVETFFHTCCVLLYVCCGKDFTSSTLSPLLKCIFVHIGKRTKQHHHRLSTSPFSSPLSDLVKHPIISLIIAMLVMSSLPRALPHPPNLLGNPEGDLELNPQPFSH